MIEIPLKIESTLNKREHWGKRSTRAKHERTNARAWLRHMQFTLTGRYDAPPWIKPPCAVTLTRIAPRELDTDNLAGGFKSVRDGVADWLGIKDNDPRVTWTYAQAKGKPREYAVRIEFA